MVFKKFITGEQSNDEKVSDKKIKTLLSLPKRRLFYTNKEKNAKIIFSYDELLKIRKKEPFSRGRMTDAEVEKLISLQEKMEKQLSIKGEVDLNAFTKKEGVKIFNYKDRMYTIFWDLLNIKEFIEKGKICLYDIKNKEYVKYFIKRRIESAFAEIIEFKFLNGTTFDADFINVSRVINWKK